MTWLWPANPPDDDPADHDEAAAQAYLAGGGDYFRSGTYSHGLFTGQSMGTAALTLNRLVARPYIVPVRRAFDRIGVDVSTAATGGSGGVLRMGIYALSGGAPGALVVDALTIGSEALGAREITISETLDPGVYFLGIVAQVATCTVRSYGTSTNVPWGCWSATGPTTPPDTVGFMSAYLNGVSGALPSPFGTPTSATSASPAVCLRAA